ncbi:3D-(3,5/4)-trihydroxycyclohexane-1,2-dione acylhydrolase (decyclizing) [Marinococcus luteus]|uniref:3D-(3,5/4)-trihydroxycyclohexane-1,2-dione acylhydrolase (decyclizing) n=1 Tax=Marinococcus luteus TaxID=1122204 RepID=UPI002ACC7901|nr:3D-(3,5/4)-trihydroxycyclohexane-1,2-dione acylhydrolase (decyclizing) [Marinococcus luteus]MDZ5782684.1 3D-(3,5/4)-trihydroxycyclohexane-1,2-dione acylhydrolase (decyclizing) [Marinococcus luteus]
MPVLTTAQAIVRFLEQQYIEWDGEEIPFVDGMFTLFGHGNVLGLGQALSEAKRLRVYQGKNEQGMGHAAISYAKQNNRKRIIACTSSVGPGSANMVTAASVATVNNIPLLLFPGDIFASRQPDPVLQQVEQPHDLTISTNDAFRPVSKFWDRITRPEQLMSSLIQAMRVLTNPAETGAVTVSVPQDVQGEAYDFPESFFQKRVHRVSRKVPDERSVKEAAALIRSKKRPFIICGGGVRYSEAGESLKKMAEAWNVPIAETQAGKSAVESTHEWNVGGLGVTGNLAANTLAPKADVIIAVGTRLADFTTSSKQLFRDENVEFISINVSEFHGVKMDAAPLIGDAQAVIDALVNETGDYTSEFKNETEEAKAAWTREKERLYSVRYTEEGFTPEIAGHLDEELQEYRKVLGTDLAQTTALGIVNREIDEDAVAVGAAGSLPGDMQRLWESSQKYRYNMEYGYSCMGYEISGAFGAKLAEPDKEVYAMVGDGSFLMLHSEMITSVQENKKINVMLFDNSGYGCINNLQMGNGMQSIGTEFRHRDEEKDEMCGSVMHIDYAKVAEGYGLKTYRVTTEQGLKEAIAEAKKQTVSTLIDVKVLPKTMTGDYESWWHVGVSEVSERESVRESFEDKEKQLQHARKY